MRADPLGQIWAKRTGEARTNTDCHGLPAPLTD